MLGMGFGSILRNKSGGEKDGPKMATRHNNAKVVGYGLQQNTMKTFPK